MKTVYKITIFLILFFISLTVSLIDTSVETRNNSNWGAYSEYPEPLNTFAAKSADFDQKEATQEMPVSITISAAGDVTLGSDKGLSNSGSLIAEYKKHNKDPNFFLKNVKEIFSKDDLTIVNLEGPLTNATKKANKKFRFKGYPEFTKVLTAGNIEAVNLANNHSHDYLEGGFSDTVKNLKKEGIGFFGYNYSYLQKHKGIKVGLLGYKGWSNSREVKKKIKKDIAKLRSKGAKLVIVSFHWGDERSNYPNSVQKDLGRYTIRNGADLVLGHHPHVIQGIEKYKNKFIVYSLGNFSFGGNRNPADKDTFIFQQTFSFKELKLADNTQVKVIPASISSVTNRNNFQPTPAKGKSKDRIIKRINKYSKNLNFSIK